MDKPSVGVFLSRRRGPFSLFLRSKEVAGQDGIYFSLFSFSFGLLAREPLFSFVFAPNHAVGFFVSREKLGEQRSSTSEHGACSWIRSHGGVSVQVGEDGAWRFELLVSLVRSDGEDVGGATNMVVDSRGGFDLVICRLGFRFLGFRLGQSLWRCDLRLVAVSVEASAVAELAMAIGCYSWWL
ncbi:hypothetical protein V8G54_036142 [Vigna mungo]|uniref:Uncharacterized protein n=1 Tax=Vigna mungo TaxID=3915 RepID=A0AAQ3RF63_VIGMU